MSAWTAADALAQLARQLHDERCRTWGCSGQPHTLDWVMAHRMLADQLGGNP
jgi:hypothetical protein